MEPYRPKGESCRYSKTSRLYRRYGSEVGGRGAGVGCWVCAREGRPADVKQTMQGSTVPPKCGDPSLGVAGAASLVVRAGAAACAAGGAAAPAAGRTRERSLGAAGGAQRQAGGALGDAIQVAGPRELDVKGDGCGPLGLGVVMGLEVLGPPALRVTLLRRQNTHEALRTGRG